MVAGSLAEWMDGWRGCWMDGWMGGEVCRWMNGRRVVWFMRWSAQSPAQSREYPRSPLYFFHLGDMMDLARERGQGCSVLVCRDRLRMCTHTHSK